MFLHLRSFEKFKFSNFKNSDVLYLDKNNSNKKYFNFNFIRRFIANLWEDLAVHTFVEAHGRSKVHTRRRAAKGFGQYQAIFKVSFYPNAPSR
jgi:hypothetical protein